MVMMHKNRSVDPHRFAMVPNSQIPRASFDRQFAHKSTFDAGYLVPFYCDEVLPGDTFNFRATLFARLATPLFPIMDNMTLSTFFFFVPNRLIWDNWQRFMGEQGSPGDSISYVIPQIVSVAGGFEVGSLADYFGLPTAGQVTAGQTVSVNALPFRAYSLIWNEWFRDENLQVPAVLSKGDATIGTFDQVVRRRGKRHDYFTSCLPWPQKGGTSVTLPLGTSAPVYGTGKALGLTNGSTSYGMVAEVSTSVLKGYSGNYNTNPGTVPSGTQPANQALGVVTSGVSGLYADLSAATAATINQLRQSFQIQKLLERDARGGTRYTEIIRAHFGVISPDARLQRPEYLGGGTSPINITPVAQNSATGLTGGSAPLGTLGGVGTSLGSHGFNQSFTEHGYVLGLVCVDADLTYQQGLHKMWSRSTRYDFYFPAFAMLGEQAVLNKEIYCVGTPAQDNAVFGYQERWAEYRYKPSMITGLFRSTSAGTIDPWHLAQRFTALPTLNSTFIESKPPVDRVVAVGAAANGKQFIFDSFCTCVTARPMPLYSVPGLIDHF